ncbi:hypothetical protein T459_30323 [Capsicum annuum]|uniref:TIR domain-containing protein n=1 Tax=Capsicum annuum TaxID=4072 RepID=A0A2G2Y829_CAPAN|nr:hypothetical protein FXO37_00266 [Capsicum annuum]PHT65898.1 hypothetical protein T459_30323 [Capsicum annuum]
MTLMQEGKIIIDDGDTGDANHVSAEMDHKKGSISKVLQAMRSMEPLKVEDIIMLQFGSFDPIGIPALKKTTRKFIQNDFSNSKKVLLRAFGAREGWGGRLTDSDLTLAFYTAGASSSSLFPCTCDVFFSLTGEDVQKNFVDHLYRALQQRGIHTFKDEKPERGKSFSPSLFKAIEESMISIIIFSQNYIASSWCLDELVKITECMKFRGQIVLHLL